MRNINNLFKLLDKLTPEDVRLAVAAHSERASAQVETMMSLGYERVGDAIHARLTEDGREIVVVGGIAYAVKKELHVKTLNNAFAEQQEIKKASVDAKIVTGTEYLSKLVCPMCNDALQHDTICPACPAGQIGYKHKYSCASGHVNLISKDEI